MSCTPQSLLSKKSEIRQRSVRLYSQAPLPFWRAVVGCIAISSLATAEPLVHFFSPARTNGRAVSLCDYKKGLNIDDSNRVHFFKYSFTFSNYCGWRLQSGPMQDSASRCYVEVTIYIYIYVDASLGTVSMGCYM